jgi:hypothetical protein
MMQQEAEAYPATSVRNSIEEGSYQNFNLPLNGVSVQGSQYYTMEQVPCNMPA